MLFYSHIVLNLRCGCNVILGTMTHKRIHYFHDDLVTRYGCRVQKLCIEGGFTCPNRDGTKAYGGCLFCDAGGSGAAHINSSLKIREQVQAQKRRCVARYGAVKFISYFQSYTNTYAPLDHLRKLYDEAVEDPDVIGLSVGTRADCLSEEICALLAKYKDSGRRVWVEIGIQTVNQSTLDKLNRAESVEDFVRAGQLVKQAGLELVTHVIVGLPGDTLQDFLATIDLVNFLQADGIKIHNLYIDSRAPLAQMWREMKVPTLSLENYVSAVCDGLERLSWGCLVHRLSGQAPRPYHLAPDWALDKQKVMAAIEGELEHRRTRQGYREFSLSLRSIS